MDTDLQQQTLENPFPGPVPYGRDDQARFRGRQTEVDRLTSLVLSTSAVLIHAPSGSGKSSLLNAGLVPELERSGMMAASPVRFAANELRLLLPEDPDQYINPFTAATCAALRRHDPALPADATTLEELSATIGAGKDGGVVLVLDQLEQMFWSLPGQWAQRAPFFEDLAKALQANSSLRAILAIRSDYLTSLAPYNRALDERFVVRFHLQSLRADQAYRVIERGFALSGLQLSADDVNTVIDKLLELRLGPPGNERVRGEFVNGLQLQIVCKDLWDDVHRARKEHADSTTLSERLSEVDLDEAMDSFVDEAMHNVSDRHRVSNASLRRWIERELITTNERRNVVLRQRDTTEGMSNSVVDALAAEQLIQVEQRNEEQWVELSHDSMVPAVLRSNAREAQKRRTKKLGRLAIVTALMVGLVLAFFALRDPPVSFLLLDETGPIDGEARVSVTTDRNVVALIHLALGGPVPATKVQVVQRGKQDKVLRSAALDVSHTEVSFAVALSRSERYDITMQTDGSEPALPDEVPYYVLQVFDAPLGKQLDTISAFEGPIDSPYVAIDLAPGLPVLIRSVGMDLGDIIGADVLTKTSDYAVIEAPRGRTPIVLAIEDYYYDYYDNTGVLPSDIVYSLSADRLPLAGLVEYEGAPITQTADVPLMIPVQVAEAGQAIVGSTCADVAVGVFTADGESLASPLFEAFNEGVLGGEGGQGAFTVVDLPAGEHRIVAVRPENGGEVRCDVWIRPLETIDTQDASTSIPIEPADEATPRVFRLDLTSEAVAILDGQPFYATGLSCFTENDVSVTSSTNDRFIAYVPASRQCLLFTASRTGLVGGIPQTLRLLPIPGS